MSESEVTRQGLRGDARAGTTPGRPMPGRTGRRRGRRRGHGRRPSSPWCRPPSSPPTTASRSSTRRCGIRRTSPATCSSAGSPVRRRCWAPAPRPPAAPRWPGRPRSRRAGRDLPVPGRAGARPRPARPVPQHAARGQGDLADERRVVDPVRLRPGRRRAAAPGAHRPGAAGSARPRPAWRRAARPGRGGLHRGPDRDTAVPAWHDGHRELPFVFVGSAAAAAGGSACSPPRPAQNARARNLALLGAARRGGRVRADDAAHGDGRRALPRGPRRAPTSGPARRCRVLGAAAGAARLAARRNRTVAALSGAALLGASAATRWGGFHAGLASAAGSQVHRGTRSVQRRDAAQRSGPDTG